jgi:hypothetical protein
MKVIVWHWMKCETPEKFKSGPEGIELSAEEIVALFDEYDVMLHHTTGVPTLFIDEKGKRFHQR